ncbi:MAG: NAD(P)-binding protein, partial [Nanoarchaeota archaeon]
RIGYDVLKSIKDQHKKCLVVDFNPNTIIELTKNRIPCLYGDAGDVELLNQLDFSKVKMVISTIPDPDTNLLLINHIKQRNPRTIIIVIAHQIDDAMKFYDEGATYVLMPHFVGGSHISELIERYNFDVKKFLDEKIKHISYLQSRKKLGHEHPRGEKFR